MVQNVNSMTHAQAEMIMRNFLLTTSKGQEILKQVIADNKVKKNEQK